MSLADPVAEQLLLQILQAVNRPVITLQIVGLAGTSNNLDSKLGDIMAAIDDLKKAQAAERADLVTLSGLVTQLLTAFAAGSITAADAQSLLDEMNAQDSTVKSNISSIQAALTPAPTPGP